MELCAQPEVTELARRVRQDLEVLSNRLIPAPMRHVAATSAGRSLARLDDLLLAPLEVTGPLYVAARDGLLSLPWAALPSRAGLPTRVHSWVDLGGCRSRRTGGAPSWSVVPTWSRRSGRRLWWPGSGTRSCC